MDLTDLSEIVEFQGCFCLTFDIKRPAAAVFDPFKIKILKINPSFISSSALIHSIKYRLEIDSEAFGGFDKEGSDSSGGC